MIRGGGDEIENLSYFFLSEVLIIFFLFHDADFVIFPA